MKRRILFVAACFMVAFSHAQSIRLALNLEAGKTYKLAVVSQTDIVQEILGQKSNTVLKSEATTSYTVSSIEKKSYRLEARFERLFLTMQTPKGAMEFQSNKEDAKDIISTILNGLINKPFVVELGKNGDVILVQGIQELFAAAVSKFPSLSLAQIAKIKTPIMNAFGEDIHASLLNLVTNTTPGKEVERGGTWSSKSVVKSVVSINSKTDFTLSDATESVWTISGKSLLTTVDKKKADAALGTPMKYDLNGTLNSEVIVDSKTGWATAATIREELKGTATMDPTDKMPNGLSIPTTLKATIQVTKP
jgi:hypothetical protein